MDDEVVRQVLEYLLDECDLSESQLAFAAVKMLLKADEDHYEVQDYKTVVDSLKDERIQEDVLNERESCIQRLVNEASR
jgi:hypothetical protein